MEAEDFEAEELLISVSVGLTFHGLDFVIGSLERSRGDGVIIVGQDAPGVGAKRLGEFVQHLDAAGFRVGDPIHEQLLGGFIIVLLENPLYELVLIPLWLAAKVLVSRDYNAVGVAMLFLRTAGRETALAGFAIVLQTRHLN